MIGVDNVTGGKVYETTMGFKKSGTALADKIDLFGWSANNETAEWGVSLSTEDSDYSGDFVDWGKNIQDGNTYRTLTKDEWYYLIVTRTNASEKKGIARIKLSDTEYANGLILLPDSWTCPADITFKSGFPSSYSSVQAYADYQIFTLAEWQQLESAGAVFLPASGWRYGSELSAVQYSGIFCSATAFHSDEAYLLEFYPLGAIANPTHRYFGLAVRLVQDIKYPISLIQPEHGTIVADKEEVAAGETITLTITPAMGYKLDQLIVKDAANNAIAVTKHTFTMPASAVTVSATFKLQTFTITAHAENGTVTGGGTYDYGTEVELKATANEGYAFSQRSDGTTDNPYRFTVISDLTLEAEFIPTTAIDNISADDVTTLRKGLRNGQVLILHNGKTYTTTGLEMK